MTDTNEPALEAETAPAGLEEILDQSGSAPQEQPKAAEPAKQADPEAKKPEKEEPFWYRKGLQKERERAKALERELEQLRKQAGQERPQPAPDPARDPQGFYQHLEVMRVQDRLERSEDRFIDRHGEQEFESVRDWLSTRPDIEQWAIQQRHPWGAAFQQYQREKLAAEIGDDPAAWRKRQEEEIEKRIREELTGQFGQQADAQPSMRIPAPASGQRSAAPRSGPGFAGPTPLKDVLGR